MPAAPSSERLEMKLDDLDPDTIATLNYLQHEGMTLKFILERSIWLYASLRFAAQAGNPITITYKSFVDHLNSRVLENK